MATLIIETSNAKNLKLIADLAKQLGSKVKSISKTDLEDITFGKMMDEVKTGEFVSKEELLKKLNK